MVGQSGTSSPSRSPLGAPSRSSQSSVLQLPTLYKGNSPTVQPFRCGAPSVNDSPSRSLIPAGRCTSKSESVANSTKVGSGSERKRQVYTVTKALKRHQLAFNKNFRPSTTNLHSHLHRSESTPAKVLELLGDAYGEGHAEIGEWIEGDWLDTEDAEANMKYDLEYGEVLPQGVTKLLGPERFDAAHSARRMVELGMGSGKLALQAFFEVPQLTEVVCVELTHSRFEMAAKALRRLIAKHPDRFSYEEVRGSDGGPSECLRLMEKDRVLEMRRGDLFEMEVEKIKKADIIFLEVRLQDDMLRRVQELLGHAKHGCRIVSFEDLNQRRVQKWYQRSLFRQLPSNMQKDYYPTSWCPSPGVWFYLYEVDHSKSAEVGAVGFSLLHSRNMSKDECYNLFRGLDLS